MKNGATITIWHTLHLMHTHPPPDPTRASAENICASDCRLWFSLQGRGKRGYCPPSRQPSQPGLAPYPAAMADGLTGGGVLQGR